MSFLLFCFVSHWRALCWLGLVLESTKHRTQPQYIQENQLSYVKSCGTAFRFFGREKSLIFPFPGISECWPLLHWKLYPTQCKGTPKAHGLRIWTGILQEERGGKESPIPNVVSETDVCVCVCAHVYTGSFTAHFWRWYHVTHLFRCLRHTPIGKGSSSTPAEYLAIILMENGKTLQTTTWTFALGIWNPGVLGI